MADGKFFGKVIKNASWWNRPWPGTQWVDNSVGAVYNGAKKGLGTGAKMLAVAGLAAAAIGVGASMVSSMRSSREYKEPEPEPMMDPAMDLPPMPQMMEPAYAMAGPQQETLMGNPLVTDGAHVQRLMAARAGRSVGVNAAAPEIEQDGRSTVDGRPVQDLGAFRM